MQYYPCLGLKIDYLNKYLQLVQEDVLGFSERIAFGSNTSLNSFNVQVLMGVLLKHRIEHTDFSQ
jgi:hypothetical protein